MSFEILPDEILDKITKICASVHLFDPVDSACIAGSVPAILCEDAGVEALSRVSSRTRCISLPILFAGIIICFEIPGGFETEIFPRFVRILAQRPHVAQNIVKVTHSYRSAQLRFSYPTPDVECFHGILPLLPRLTHISTLNAFVPDGLIQDFNEHPTLKVVEIDEINSITDNETFKQYVASLSPGYYRKIHVQVVEMVRFPDFLFLEHICKLGLQIGTLQVDAMQVDLSRIGRICCSNLTELCLSCGWWDIQASLLEQSEFLGALEAFLRELSSESPLARIRFTCYNSGHPLNKIAHILPLLGDLLTCRAYAGTTLGQNFQISECTLQRSESTPVPSIRPTNPGYWSRSWDIVGLGFSCAHWSINASRLELEMLAERAPLIEKLSMYQDYWEGRDYVRTSDIIQIAPVLGAFSHLRCLTLTNVTIRDIDECGGDDPAREGDQDVDENAHGGPMQESDAQVLGGNEDRDRKWAERLKRTREIGKAVMVDMCSTLREHIPSLEKVYMRASINFSNPDNYNAYLLRDDSEIRVVVGPY